MSLEIDAPNTRVDIDSSYTTMRITHPQVLVYTGIPCGSRRVASVPHFVEVLLLVNIIIMVATRQKHIAVCTLLVRRLC